MKHSHPHHPPASHGWSPWGFVSSLSEGITSKDTIIFSNCLLSQDSDRLFQSYVSYQVIILIKTSSVTSVRRVTTSVSVTEEDSVLWELMK